MHPMNDMTRLDINQYFTEAWEGHRKENVLNEHSFLCPSQASVVFASAMLNFLPLWSAS